MEPLQIRAVVAQAASLLASYIEAYPKELSFRKDAGWELVRRNGIVVGSRPVSVVNHVLFIANIQSLPLEKCQDAMAAQFSWWQKLDLEKKSLPDVLREWSSFLQKVHYPELGWMDGYGRENPRPNSIGKKMKARLFSKFISGSQACQLDWTKPYN